MLRAFSFTMLSLFFLLGCSKKSDEFHFRALNQAKLKKSETLRYALTNEPTGFDWSKTGDMQANWLQSLVMDGLVQWDFSDEQQSVKPALATHWEPKKNGLIWTFYLRKGVRWSDGKEFTAKHAYDGIIRTLDPKTAARDSGFLYLLENGQEFNHGQIKDPKAVGVKVVNNSTIEFTLKSPVAFFPMRLANHTTFPVRMDLINKFGSQWTQPSNLVTLGPYNLKKWKNNELLFLTRNDSYWGQPAKIKNLILLIVDSDKTRLNMFKQGKLDFAKNPPLTEIKHLQNDPHYREAASLSTTYLGFKVEEPPFNNKFLRQAIAYSIDKTELIKSIGGTHQPIETWYSPAIKKFQTDLKPVFSKEKAMKALSQSGLSLPSSGNQLLMGFNLTDLNKQLVENVQNQIKKNLGLEIQLEHQEWKTYLQKLNSRKSYHIFRLGWGGIEVDPHNFMALLTTKYRQNKTGWSNEEYDKLIEKAVSEQNLEKRKSYYKKALSIIAEEVPAIPLIGEKYRAMVHKRLKNVELNLMKDDQVYKWEIKESGTEKK